MDAVKKSKKKIIIERVVILLVALGVIGLLVYFLSGTFFPFIKLEIARDFDGAKELLASKGWIGFITVSVIEALQMVVIFIPAEFIQLTSGMAYPWWIAIILCDIGVILGSTIIYFLVNIFKFDGDIFNRSSKIEKYARLSRSNSTMALMYVLFIMPIIPFGAICYYGSSKKVPYWKYVITCGTGVIPSIATSILMGTAVKEFIANSIPIWLLVLIIIGAAAILFVLLAFVLHHFFFKQNENTPYSWYYGLMATVMRIFTGFFVRYHTINKEAVKELEGSYLLLANHHAWFDFMGIYYLDKDQRYSIVSNNYILRLPFLGRWLKKSGAIPKKMFTVDINCIKGILKAKKDGYPILMFPEARLSTDGGHSMINPSIVKLIRKLNIPLVLVQLRNAYFVMPKWRGTMKRGRFDSEVKVVLKPETYASMSDEELLNIIESNLYFNEFENENIVAKGRNKAHGLEHILYRCPHCGEFYSNVTKGNTMTCSKCGTTYEIDNHYQFKDGEYKNIHDYYQAIKEYEKEHINETKIDVEVDTKIFTDGVKEPRLEKGTFHLDVDGVRYENENGLVFEFKNHELEGIPYSVNEEFEMYFNNELYYFYPTNVDRSVCTRIALVFEIKKELEEYERRSCSKENE
ncbi:MAG: VTT domain-containing protein [Bacilli bacterium]|nr:VTT domain-containing protein [Bacilli bacterium]